MEDVIAGLRVIGRTRTSETYQTTLNSFKRFRNYIDLPLDHFDSHIVLAYEAYLKSCRVSLNSSSFYMRNLRAMYNRAVDTGFTQQRFPFKHVYTGVDKTLKRLTSYRNPHVSNWEMRHGEQETQSHLRSEVYFHSMGYFHKISRVPVCQSSLWESSLTTVSLCYCSVWM